GDQFFTEYPDDAHYTGNGLSERRSALLSAVSNANSATLDAHMGNLATGAVDPTIAQTTGALSDMATTLTSDTAQASSALSRRITGDDTVHGTTVDNAAASLDDLKTRLTDISEMLGNVKSDITEYHSQVKSLVDPFESTRLAGDKAIAAYRESIDTEANTKRLERARRTLSGEPTVGIFSGPEEIGRASCRERV